MPRAGCPCLLKDEQVGKEMALIFQKEPAAARAGCGQGHLLGAGACGGRGGQPGGCRERGLLGEVGAGCGGALC